MKKVVIKDNSLIMIQSDRYLSKEARDKIVEDVNALLEKNEFNNVGVVLAPNDLDITILELEDD